MNGLLVCFASFFGWWWLVRCVYFGLGMAWCISLSVLRSWHGCGHVWWAMGLLGSWYGCDGVWWGLNMCMMGWWYGHGGVVKWVWPPVGSWCAYSVPLISWCHESLVLWSHDIGAAVLWIMINEYQVYAVQVWVPLGIGTSYWCCMMVKQFPWCLKVTSCMFEGCLTNAVRLQLGVLLSHHLSVLVLSYKC